MKRKLLKLISLMVLMVSLLMSGNVVEANSGRHIDLNNLENAQQVVADDFTAKANDQSSYNQITEFVRLLMMVEAGVAILLTMGALVLAASRTGRALQAGQSTTMSKELMNIGKLVSNIAIYVFLVNIIILISVWLMGIFNGGGFWGIV